MNHLVDRSTTIAIIAVTAIFVPLLASSVAVLKALPPTAGVMLGWTVLLWTFLVWRRVQGIW